jgi:hypothetical protein
MQAGMQASARLKIQHRFKPYDRLCLGQLAYFLNRPCGISDGWNRTPNSQSSAKSCTHVAHTISNLFNVITVLFSNNKIFIYSTNTLPKLHMMGVRVRVSVTVIVLSWCRVLTVLIFCLHLYYRPTYSAFRNFFGRCRDLDV